jgi:tripartite ATP-independent transporter DctP family solute receptor
MKRILSVILGVVILSVSLLGCQSGQSASQTVSKAAPNSTSAAPAPSGKTIEFKLGHIQPEDDPWQKGAEKFKEGLESKSNGTMTVKIYPNSTLGGDRDLAEGMQMGTVDFALIAGVLSNFEKSVGLLELPYLFNSQDEFDKIIQGDIGQEITQRVLKNANIRILNFWDRGPREVTSNKPINSLADIQGLKIRVPEINAMVVTWKAMGATPTPMAWNEVYTSLQQNVIEAQENPIPYIYSNKLQEVQKYIAMTDHKYEYVTLSMSNQKWKSLTKDQQKIVTEAAKEATDYENQLVQEVTDKDLEALKSAGMTVTKPDKSKFAEKARSAHADFAKTVDYDLYERIIKALGRS